MSAGHEKLRFLLELQSSTGGAIPFERWMAEALYHPDYGYYTANIRDIGRRGDFTTWPLLHKNLARAIAGWALKVRPQGGWHLIEAGAGTGELAREVLRALGWWKRVRYHIVEISPVLRRKQQAVLGRRVEWHADMGQALEACEGKAVIFSNELVDAFPCRLFQKQSGAWRELSLQIEGGKIIERWQDAVLPDSTIFSEAWPEGQRVEVQSSFRDWMEGWLPAWKAGAMLTIDYGDLAPQLYARRISGSLRAYAHHHRFVGSEVYGAFGLRDLTCDVNFSDLMAWMPGADYMTLGAFMEAQGQEEAPDFAEASEAFKVLIQAR